MTCLYCRLVSRDPPIMLIIFLLCYAALLPIMLKFMFKTYLLCSNYVQFFYASVPMHC